MIYLVPAVSNLLIFCHNDIYQNKFVPWRIQVCLAKDHHNKLQHPFSASGLHLCSKKGIMNYTPSRMGDLE